MKRIMKFIIPSILMILLIYIWTDGKDILNGLIDSQELEDIYFEFEKFYQEKQLNLPLKSFSGNVFSSL